MVCKKNLDSTTVAVHVDEIYCKSCYGKKYGPKGYGFGGGAGTLSMDGGEGLGIKPEQWGRPHFLLLLQQPKPNWATPRLTLCRLRFHAASPCLTFLSAFSLFFPNRQAPHRPTNNPNASKFAQRAEGADVCPRCEKTVYAAEKCLGAGKVGAWVHVFLLVLHSEVDFATAGHRAPLCSLPSVLA